MQTPDDAVLKYKFKFTAHLLHTNISDLIVVCNLVLDTTDHFVQTWPGWMHASGGCSCL